jgi:hypothetical protein
MVVNGYSQNGLEFSREAKTEKEKKAAIDDAWETPHVTKVAVHYYTKGDE